MSGSRRLPVLALGLAAVLATVVVGSSIRDRHALPAAAHRVWQAQLAIDGFVTCIQGVSDDLSGTGGRRQAHALATERLGTCDPAAVAKAARVNLPPEPPLMPGSLEAPRRALEDAASTLHQAALDARTVHAAAIQFVRDGADGATLAVGVASLQGELGRLQLLLLRAVCGGVGDTSLRLLVGCVQQNGLHAAVADGG